jgi:hypothetical protein
MRKKIIHRPEQELQQAVVQNLRLILPDTVVWLHVPNGGWRSATEAAIMVGLGVCPGAPDLLFMWRDIRTHLRVAWIELKAGNRPATSTQLGFHARVRAIGHHVGIARSIDEVLTLLRDFGVPHHRATLSPPCPATHSRLP